jgi:hypothetical protein
MHHVTLNEREVNFPGLKQLKILDGAAGGEYIQRKIVGLTLGGYSGCQTSVVAAFLASRQNHFARLRDGFSRASE